MPQQPVVYGNAEARGKVRAWKTQLHKKYQIFEAAYRSLNVDNSALNAACFDLVKRKSRIGKERAVERLQKLFGPGVKLETVRYDRQHSYAVWSILKPREPVTVDAADESGLNQFCVTVNYVMAGRSPKDGVGCAEGTWTLEVPDHALGV